MKLPRGRLRKSRVVADPRETLADVLDRGLTGYAVFESQETLLLEADGRGVITFADGVPVLAYHTGTDRGGAAALADLAGPGPLKVDRRVVAPDALDPVHDADGHDQQRCVDRSEDPNSPHGNSSRLPELARLPADPVACE
jgi:hypothetical protein